MCRSKKYTILSVVTVAVISKVRNVPVVIHTGRDTSATSNQTKKGPGTVQGFFFALFKPVTCNLSSCVPVSLELDLEGGPRDRFQTEKTINVWERFYLR